MNKIKALIDAGKKATQGEFYSSSHRPDQANIKVLNGSLSVKEHPTLCVFAANLIQPSDEKHSTAEFFVQALNTRADIEALYEAAKNMAEALVHAQDAVPPSVTLQIIDQALDQFNALKDDSNGQT